MKLNELKNNTGARHKIKLVGRGPGSGHGKTSCRGHKGQLSRSGTGRKLGFEGGQIPLYRRLPKRGFHNLFRRDFTLVNVEALNKFSNDSEVNPELLYKSGLARSGMPVKILGNGELKNSVKVTAHKFSLTAKQKIEKAGGTVIELKK